MGSIGPTPSEIYAKLLDRWIKGYFLRNLKEVFPYTLSLGTLTSKQISESFDAVREWIRSFQDSKKLSAFLQWEEVNFRNAGRNSVPKRLVFETPQELAGYLNRMAELRIFTESLEKLSFKDERLFKWGKQHPLDLLRVSDDLERLLNLWQWMHDHPKPSIYLRQIDLPGIDTKFTEKHQKLLTDWLDLTLPEEQFNNKSSRFETRYGYIGKPELIRFRILDPNLLWNECDDITIPASQFCSLYTQDEHIPIKNVFVVENDISALSFPQAEKSIVVFGRGYHFDHWKDCTWLQRTNLYYWGDLDTHGFSILDEFRSMFSHTISFLMDKQTLLDHEVSWGEEPKPTYAELTHLTKEEQSVYTELRFNMIRVNLRLEQEFIRYNKVKEKVRAIASGQIVSGISSHTTIPS